jgi:GNAT superfamily N-acetyltransferase
MASMASLRVAGVITAGSLNSPIGYRRSTVVMRILYNERPGGGHYNSQLSMQFVVAEGPILEEILDATHPVWNEGLTRNAYARWNAAQLRTTWGADHLRRFALLDARGRWVASAKRYLWPIRLDGVDGLMCGIGAVFTRPEARGHGYARTMIERLIEQSRGEGAVIAGLFSEIGEQFYERAGFRTVALNEVDVQVERKDGAPAMLVRSGEVRDLPALAAMHATRSAGVRFALRRDPPLIEYALAKKRLFAGLGQGAGPRIHRQTEFFVAEEGASAVAYVVLTVSPAGWTLEEAGDRDPAGARLGAILQVLLAREPSHPAPLIRAWWPPAMSVPPQLRLANQIPARDVFMLRPIGDIRIPSQAEDVFYWRSDYF